MIEPTVGHMVWFHAGGHETAMQSDQPLPAIVTYVHPHRHSDGISRLVNLAVFGREGSLWSKPSIRLWGGEGYAPESGSYVRFMDEKASPSDDTEPNREEGESYADWQARSAKWREQRAEQRRVSQSAMDARGNMDHGPPAPGLPNPALQGTQWDPDMPANTKAKTDAKAKADAEAKAKADKEAADAKRKAAQAERDKQQWNPATGSWDP